MGVDEAIRLAVVIIRLDSDSAFEAGEHRVSVRAPLIVGTASGVAIRSAAYLHEHVSV